MKDRIVYVKSRKVLILGFAGEVILENVELEDIFKPEVIEKIKEKTEE